MNARDNYIDFLRFLGLSLIVITHINAPAMLTQVRAFDVPLMIFASGLAYGTKSTIDATWKGFYWPRIKRLLIPVYIFIPFYLLLLYIARIPITTDMFIRSYLLTLKGSIGYVWIIRVFLLITLVTPLLVHLKYKLSTKQVVGVIVVMLALSELSTMLFTGIAELSIIQEFFVDIVPYLLGYSSIFLLGLMAKTVIEGNKKLFDVRILILLIISILVAFYFTRGTIINGEFSFVDYKYPPQFFFLAYGILCCLIIYGLKPYLNRIGKSKFVLFVGQNTIWIYLWHMIYVIIGNKYLPHWAERFVFVYGASILTYYVQYRIVEYIGKKQNCNFMKYFKG